MKRPSLMTVEEYIAFTHHMSNQADIQTSNMLFFAATHDQAKEYMTREMFLINYHIPKIDLGGQIIITHQWLRFQGLNQNDILHAVLGDINKFLRVYLTKGV